MYSVTAVIQATNRQWITLEFIKLTWKNVFVPDFQNTLITNKQTEGSFSYMTLPILSHSAIHFRSQTSWAWGRKFYNFTPFMKQMRSIGFTHVCYNKTRWSWYKTSKFELYKIFVYIPLYWYLWILFGKTIESFWWKQAPWSDNSLYFNNFHCSCLL